MLKLIHAADLHLDSPFAGLRPERAAQRRREQRKLLERLAALAAEKQADLVLLAGDLLDGSTVYQETATALAAGKVLVPIGLIAAAFSIAGHYLGAGMTIRNGAKAVRPVILVVLTLLAVKVVLELLGM